MLLRRCTIVSLLVIGIAVLTGGLIQQHRNTHRMPSIIDVSFTDRSSQRPMFADKTGSDDLYVANTAALAGDEP